MVREISQIFLIRLRFVASDMEIAYYNIKVSKGTLMRYLFSQDKNLVTLRLSGQVNIQDWQSCFWEAEQLFLDDRCELLLVDAEGLTEFSFSQDVCIDLLPGFVSFSKRAAIFASASPIFGMLKVVQGYSHNDELYIHRTQEDAMAILRPLLVSQQTGLSLQQ